MELLLIFVQNNRQNLAKRVAGALFPLSIFCLYFENAQIITAYNIYKYIYICEMYLSHYTQYFSMEKKNIRKKKQCMPRAGYK